MGAYNIIIYTTTQIKYIPGLIVCYILELTGGSFYPLEYELPPVDTTLLIYTTTY